MKTSRNQHSLARQRESLRKFTANIEMAKEFHELWEALESRKLERRALRAENVKIRALADAEFYALQAARALNVPK